MRCIAICDDDPNDLAELCQMVSDFLHSRRLDLALETFTNSAFLLAALQANPERYILLLLDIYLGDENGVYLAKALREQNISTRLVFTTISPDFALEGYKVRADDYLLKPVTPDTLQSTLDRLFCGERILHLETADGTHLLPISDILYAEAQDHYVTVVTGTAVWRIRSTLAAMETRLGPDGFVRCHKGYLANVSHIRQLRGTELTLSIGLSIPVGRQYRSSVQRVLAEHTALRLPSLR